MKNKPLSFGEQVKKLVAHPEKITVTTLKRDIFQEVAMEFTRERAKRGFEEYTTRLNEDWGVLNSQIVGAEYR